MEEASQAEITRLLRAWGDGDAEALNRLTPFVYDELRRMARGYLRREGPDHSLQATALVHEAYLKLVDARVAQWQDRAHFFAISARLMRRILVDAARTRVAGKRGGGAVRVEINESLDGAPLDSDQMVRLDDALDALTKFDARKAKVWNCDFSPDSAWRKLRRCLRFPNRACCATGSWRGRGWRARWMERLNCFLKADEGVGRGPGGPPTYGYLRGSKRTSTSVLTLFGVGL